MKDQYGQPVPNDLVALTCGIDRFTPEELEIIDNSRWYEVQHYWGIELAVSFSEVEGLVDEPLGDKPITVKYIDYPLHRYDKDNGFYHV